MMNPLPGIYLTWDQSTIDPASFLRYQIYYRQLGALDWIKIARVSSVDRNFYFFYEVASDLPYEFAVTQVQDINGEEFESEFSTVNARVRFLYTFIHLIRNASFFAEIPTLEMRTEESQDITFVQVWNRSTPTAHIGLAQTRTFSMSTELTWGVDEDVFEAVRDVLTQQKELGTVVCLRDHKGLRIFGQLISPSRSDRTVQYSLSLQVVETFYNEAVD